ncbi:hypothetical protein [Maridesulfovibrio sp. FT414]|uniref:hypothetical protein n=1 Tax=Maridesulfovibrio sp. FT414 TaxID=2979469 RepID=UPI003D80608D
MKKFKIPVLIFAAVFVISAAALLYFIKKDIGGQPDTEVAPPAWVHENGSSGKQPISGKIVKSGDQLTKPAQTAQGNNSLPATTETPQAAGQPAAEEKTSEPGTNQTTPGEESKGPIVKTLEEIRATIVTEVFMDSLAAYIADSYQPAGSLPHNPAKGFSTASFKGINTHFGLNLRGLMPEAQSLDTARQNIWAEVLSPGTLARLYETDSKTLLDLVEEKGIIAERKFVEGATFELRELTTAQRAEMFRASALPLRHAAAVLTAIAENRDLLQALDGYFKAEKRVDIANGVFQADLSQSQNSNSVNARNKAAHSGQVLKDAITVREKIKVGVTEKIKAFCSGPCDSPNDLFYIAKWVFRRTKDNEKRIESILAGCKLLNDLAVQMEKRADLVEQAM